jgi:hypothetical protein
MLILNYYALTGLNNVDVIIYHRASPCADVLCPFRAFIMI